AVPLPQTLPRIEAARIPTNERAQPLTTTERQQATLAADCGEGRPDEPPEIHALSGTAAVVLVACGGGPYNFPYRALIASGTPGARRFAVARFDRSPPPAVLGTTALVYNPVWNEADASLGNDFRARSL